jgi:exodeoxyribonuclease VII large subunit
VLIYPVTVQGDAAKTQIESAIRKAETDARCDVIILARGGGSIEDLWSFNEENVAKAIYHASIPIIVGVGHEIDFTIADFVADVRAPTPSAAAELVTQDKAQLLTSVLQNELWLQQKMQQILNQKQQQLDWKIARLNAQKPANKVLQQAQRLDDVSMRLKRCILLILENKHNQHDRLQQQLLQQQPSRKITHKHNTLQNLNTRLHHAVQQILEQQQNRLSIHMARLDSISPLKTLERGYAIVRDKTSSKLISSVKQTKPDQAILVHLKDGEISAIVD